MADAQHYPASWKAYCTTCRKNLEAPNRDWAIFATRYRIAGNFAGSNWWGMQASLATKSYDAAIHILLSYSALEAACKAANVSPSDIRLDYTGGYLDDCRRIVRNIFIKYSENDFPLRNALSNAKLQKKLDDFFSNRTEDLMPFATAIRHLFAHGVWTPTGSNAYSKTAINALDLMAQGLQVAGEDLFLEFWENVQIRKGDNQ